MSETLPIKITDTLEARFWKKVDKKEKNSCWLWLGARLPSGYGRLFLFKKNGIPYSRGAHRIAYTLLVGDIPNGLLVCHKCDNPPCCNPDHLFLGTYKTNGQDMVLKKRNFTPACKGEANGKSKLTNQLIQKIRFSKLPSRQLAKELGICKSSINYVRSKVLWKHIP